MGSNASKSTRPLVSVIVPTKNSAEFLRACLQSIADQSYDNIELIVVDNSSTDDTQKIAKEFTKHVYTKGPERSAQRNFGVSKSKGDYVLIIDSDMELTKDVVLACVEKSTAEENLAGIIIPEMSFGEGFWAKCKALEKSFYIGVDWIEAARYFPRTIYLSNGGYNEMLISGEDWDMSNRARRMGEVLRVDQFIRHNEGNISLSQTLKKKKFYASKINSYIDANDDVSRKGEIVRVFKRFGLYLRQPIKLIRRPHIGIGMIYMKVCEYGYGAIGYIKVVYRNYSTISVKGRH